MGEDSPQRRLKIRKSLSVNPAQLMSEDLPLVYFGWKENGKNVQRVMKGEESSADGPPSYYLQLGWLDGVGTWKHGTVDSKIVAWETEPRIQAFDHVPMRAVLDVFV